MSRELSWLEEGAGGGWNVLVDLRHQSWPVFYGVCHVAAVDEVEGPPVGEVFFYVVDFELAIWRDEFRLYWG
jgi:hypothetical protein